MTDNDSFKVGGKVGYVINQMDNTTKGEFINIDNSKFSKTSKSYDKVIFEGDIEYKRELTKYQDIKVKLSHSKQDELKNTNLSFSYNLKF